jgi:predicted dehydrogenase
MKTALIGYGYWGRNIARTIDETNGMQLLTIFDEDKERVKEAKKLYNFKEYG